MDESVPAERRLNLLDIMILVGAIAVQVAYARGRDEYYRGFYGVATTAEILRELRKIPPDLSSIPAIANLNAVLFTRHAPSLLLGTITWLVLRLRRPRPSLRELAHQPGYLASVVVVSGFSVGSVLTFLHEPVMFDGNPADWLIAGIWTPRVGLAVAAAWLTLRLNSRWCPERGWIDRSGRVLGVLWIGMGLLASWDG
jgi:hypothetical protein